MQPSSQLGRCFGPGDGGGRGRGGEEPSYNGKSLIHNTAATGIEKTLSGAWSPHHRFFIYR
jgi:hypothetical protein